MSLWTMQNCFVRAKVRFGSSPKFQIKLYRKPWVFKVLPEADRQSFEPLPVMADQELVTWSHVHFISSRWNWAIGFISHRRAHSYSSSKSFTWEENAILALRPDSYHPRGLRSCNQSERVILVHLPSRDRLLQRSWTWEGKGWSYRMTNTIGPTIPLV